MKSSSEQNLSVASTPEHNISAVVCQAPNSTGKWCPKCLHFRLRLDFYANKQTKDGLDCYCKKCRKKCTSQWKGDNRDRDRTSKKERYNKEDAAKYKARHRALHRDRDYARYQIQKAKEHGLVLYQCSWPNCTETEKVEGHHPSYKKPHEIVSLCFLHHKATDLLGDKLGFDLQITDISHYLKPSKLSRPRKTLSQRVGVSP